MIRIIYVFALLLLFSSCSSITNELDRSKVELVDNSYRGVDVSKLARVEYNYSSSESGLSAVKVVVMHNGNVYQELKIEKPVTAGSDYTLGYSYDFIRDDFAIIEIDFQGEFKVVTIPIELIDFDETSNSLMSFSTSDEGIIVVANIELLDNVEGDKWEVDIYIEEF